MAIHDLAPTLRGTKERDGAGLVDRNGTPLSNWSRNADLSSSVPDEEACVRIRQQQGSYDEQDEAYIGELLEFMQRKKFRRKAIKIENRSSQLEEMELFALGVNGFLDEIQQKVEESLSKASEESEKQAEWGKESPR
ncbi:hypothetical protein SADUNF_Sadunf05G0169100 [Salix dunnii]|uniref:Uncharacterized protein n=1 Tax=Salix dunnii TaxID=1413687 RepID=A0A835K947_9ROSI|nr:hypothetical protein SADUNF_Sadunf05G0169100 [Salix dunnii]